MKKLKNLFGRGKEEEKSDAKPTEVKPAETKPVEEKPKEQPSDVNSQKRPLGASSTTITHTDTKKEKHDIESMEIDNKQESSKQLDPKVLETKKAFHEGKRNVSSYLTLLTTDKPIYRPSETVYIRGVILHSITFKPYEGTAEGNLQIFAPDGNKILNVQGHVSDSVFSGFFEIPEDATGGDYKIKVVYPYNEGFAGAEREFNIRAFRAPRLKTQLKFLQKAYGPGDNAVAKLEVTRAEGGVPEEASIEAVARIDNVEVFRGPAKLDKEGNTLIRFTLPQKMTSGDGTLICTIQDGGVVETASKTIPILLSTMKVDLYPEGGDLIAGVPCRFYFEAFTKSGDPADITAEVRVKNSTDAITTVSTEHEGRGRGIFTPASGQEYVLHILKPSGILNEIAFPTVKQHGITVQSTNDVFTTNTIDLKVTSTKDESVTVSLYRKTELLSTVTKSLKAKEETIVSLDTQGAEGVLIATIIQGRTPVSERLVFRKPTETLEVSVKTDKDSYVPGGKVKLNITTTKRGQPVKACVGVQVADDSVLEMVEKRKQAPRLPQMALLEVEVDHLHDCTFYFDEKEPSANMAIDLLLGTQGWRRFVVHDQTKFLNDKELAAERVLGKHTAQIKYRHFDLAWEVEECEVNFDVDMDNQLMVQQMEAPDINLIQLNAPPPMPMAELAVAAPAPVPIAFMAQAELPPPMPVLEKQVAAPAPAPGLMMEAKAAAPPPAPMAFLAPAAPPPMAIKPLALPPPRMDNDMKEEAAIMKDEEMWLHDCDEDEPNIIENDNLEQQAVVREYAHQVSSFRRPGDRTDFTETLYWNANVSTDEKGVAQVTFDLNDSVTSFRAFVDGFTSDGVLGTTTCLVESKEPFYLEPKMPLEVSFGDVIHVPVAMVNSTSDTLKGDFQVDLIGTSMSLSGPPQPDFSLAANERSRKTITLKTGQVAEEFKLKVSAKSGAISDAVTRSTKVVPKGFPFTVGLGGLLEANSKSTFRFTIPDSVVAGSFTTNAKVFSTPASTLTESIKGFITEPCGCFEQTSMTSYPLVMVLQYFKTHTGVDPKLIESANINLEKGYKRLTSYECKQGGYEWFGGDPGHEALTAYGVLQFTDMSKVYPVDQAMLKRTTDWLLKRRDGKGGFLRNSRALDCFGGAPEATTNAYIVWALTEAGIDVKPELEAAIKLVKDTNMKDAYVLALVTASLYKLGRNDEAKHYAEHLAKLQKADGRITDGDATITRSYGESKDIETTAIAVLCWLRGNSFNEPLEKSVQFLNSCCKNGRFSSTQATVLALKAIVAYDELRSSLGAEGSVVLRLDGKEVSSVGFDKTTTGTIEMPSFANELTAGNHEAELEMVEGGRMPFTVTVDYFSLSGSSSDQCSVKLHTSLSAKSIKEGEGTEVQVELENTKKEALPMTVAVIGIPGGLEVRHDKLKEFVKSDQIAFYEVIGRNVNLYWRYLNAGEKKKLNLDVVAAVPGSYVGPASRAYLYYTNEHKSWNEGLSVEITPK